MGTAARADTGHVFSRLLQAARAGPGNRVGRGGGPVCGSWDISSTGTRAS